MTVPQCRFQQSSFDTIILAQHSTVSVMLYHVGRGFFCPAQRFRVQNCVCVSVNKFAHVYVASRWSISARLTVEGLLKELSVTRLRESPTKAKEIEVFTILKLWVN